MQRNYILPFVLNNPWLYKSGIVDVQLKCLLNDTYVYVYYDISKIKNRRAFMFYMEQEKYFYNSTFDKYLIIKLKLSSDIAWYVKTIYYGGSDFIAHTDLIHNFKQKIPAARESSRDLFLLFVYFHYAVFSIFTHSIWTYCSTRINSRIFF